MLTSVKGTTLTTICSTVMPLMPEATNRFSPSGGVWNPMESAQMTTIPTWVGSAPSMYMIGISTGTRIMMAASVSMNMPTKSSSTIRKSHTTSRLSVMPSSCAASCAGISSSTSTRPNTVAANRISSTRPVIQVVASRASRALAQVISRCSTTPTSNV